jgi:hypothetical protein
LDKPIPVLGEKLTMKFSRRNQGGGKFRSKLCLNRERLRRDITALESDGAFVRFSLSVGNRENSQALIMQ